MDFVTKFLTVIVTLTVVIQPTVSRGSDRTLAFVFDVTFSMIADLEHLKLVIEDLFKEITENLERHYSDYLFIAFHDPGENRALDPL